MTDVKVAECFKQKADLVTLYNFNQKICFIFVLKIKRHTSPTDPSDCKM